MRQQIGKYARYLLCVASGILLFAAAQASASGGSHLSDGALKRNDAGEGEYTYELYVDGLDEGRIPVTLTVPERNFSDEEFKEAVPDAARSLCEGMIGENVSLSEIRCDLDLPEELPEYGLSVTWSSSMPEIVNDMGFIAGEGIPNGGVDVIMTAVLRNGLNKESVDIPITVLPPLTTPKERLTAELDKRANDNMQEPSIVLPDEFEGKKLTYHENGSSSNYILILLGFAMAGLLYVKEKNDLKTAQKEREDSLLLDYSDLVSRFLVLTGAGYPAKQAWIKQVEDFKRREAKEARPLYDEMEITMNQMLTGTPEGRAYADFARRIGLRCYVKFASMLESSLNTGGRNLRALLEAEMEDAFKKRQDIARKKGEEASTKLLVPMFLMLGIVMVMIVTPAFLSFG